jgi:hypothetical protein
MSDKLEVVRRWVELYNDREDPEVAAVREPDAALEAAELVWSERP